MQASDSLSRDRTICFLICNTIINNQGDCYLDLMYCTVQKKKCEKPAMECILIL